MPRYGSKSSPNTYDAQADLVFAEIELTSIALFLGLGNDIEALTIDDIVGSLREQFWWGKEFPAVASNDLAKETFILLVNKSRRLWRRRHIARAVANG